MGAVGGPLGALLGALAGFVLGAVIGWIVSWAKDEIFEPQVVSITLPSATSTFDGESLVSPEVKLVFKDYGGKYTLTFDWELVQ